MLKWKFGDTTITQLIELKDDTGAIPVLPDATPENLATIPWLKPHFITPDNKLILNIQMMIIETPDRKMVVDTCIGNDKNLAMDAWANMQRPFLDNLKKTNGHAPLLAYGGQVFNSFPHITERLGGTYLGEDAGVAVRRLGERVGTLER